MRGDIFEICFSQAISSQKPRNVVQGSELDGINNETHSKFVPLAEISDVEYLIINKDNGSSIFDIEFPDLSPAIDPCGI